MLTNLSTKKNFQDIKVIKNFNNIYKFAKHQGNLNEAYSRIKYKRVPNVTFIKIGGIECF